MDWRAPGVVTADAHLGGQQLDPGVLRIRQVKPVVSRLQLRGAIRKNAA